MAIVISGNGIDMGNNPVSNASRVEVQEEQVSPFGGFKNYIINGRKAVNQRGLTSTDNSYNQDRWYKAGNNWFQGIEGANNLISGKKYTLSWVGSATASYYVGNATSSTINSQTFIPIENGGSFILNISAGQNLWIRFESDATGSTFNFVQLEEGSVATPFENRHIGLELSLCQRYYETSDGNLHWTTYDQVRATYSVNPIIMYNTSKRVTASLNVSESKDSLGLQVIGNTINGFDFRNANHNISGGADKYVSWTASAEL